MKGQAGFTLIELVITVTILSVLTSISLISFSAPKALLEKETVKTQVLNLIQQAKLKTSLTGQGITLSFTPWALWMDEKKALEFPKDGPFQWQTRINTVKIGSDSSIQVVDNTGKTATLPQEAILTYNHKRLISIKADPKTGSIGPDERRDGFCQN